VSQRSEWRRFVERRRRELRDAYPCAAPTNRRVCPKHRSRITGVCKPCRDELYEQLAAEYEDERDVVVDESIATPQSSTFPGRQPTTIPGQLSLIEDREENAMSNTEIVEGELLPCVYEPATAPNLFGTDDPQLVVVKAADVSKALARVVRDRKLFVRINGKDYVLIGGWTLLGSMLGVFPIVVWSRKLEDGWEARVEAKTRDGAIVGAAESECLRSERKWAKADDYAIRSMAQTRATAKALRLPLGFVFELEGFEGTPADEIPTDDVRAQSTPSTAGKIPNELRPTDEQKSELLSLVRTLNEIDPERDWTMRCRELAGVDWKKTTRAIAHELIEKLQIELQRLVDEEPETVSA
jgi:hypothetical protein